MVSRRPIRPLGKLRNQAMTSTVSKDLTIALDAMGGDQAPRIVIEGVELALQKHPDVRFLLFGDETAMASLLREHSRAAAACEVRHTPQRVSMEDKPSQVLRRGRKSSMGLAISSIKEGQAHAMVSAGNTGGLMALAMYVLSTMKGIDRPAIAALWPKTEGQCVFLDMGANVAATAKQLADFAILGVAFAHVVLGKKNPTVALLNVGAEELKGHESVRDAAAILKDSNLDLNFVGFTEGSDIPFDGADVVVTDGFTGNVALKTAEGTARFIAFFMKRAFNGSVLTRLGAVLARSAFGALRGLLDTNAQNGGVFLGLNGIVVKSHGAADGRGFASAIEMAIDLAHSNFAEEIAESVKRLNVELAKSDGDVMSGGEQEHQLSSDANREIAAQ